MKTLFTIVNTNTGTHSALLHGGKCKVHCDLCGTSDRKINYTKAFQKEGQKALILKNRLTYKKQITYNVAAHQKKKKKLLINHYIK